MSRISLLSLFSRFRRNTNGATAVEAALCLPIILLMLLACFQYAIFFFASSSIARTMDKSYRDVVIIENPTSADVKALVTQNLSKHSNYNITNSVNVVEQYGKSFANISAEFTHNISIPFAPKISIKRKYKSMVLISTDHDSNS